MEHIEVLTLASLKKDAEMDCIAAEVSLHIVVGWLQLLPSGNLT